MNPLTDNRQQITRRALFGKAATGIGVAALAPLLGESASAMTPGVSSFPNFAPKRRSVACRFI